MSRRHRLRASSSRWLIVCSAVGAVLFLAGSVVWAQLGQQAAQVETGQLAQERDQVAVERDVAAGQAQSLAEQIRAECLSGALNGPVCVQAEQVASTPVPPVPGPEGPQGPGPTADQIQDAVEIYLLANPPPAGRAPTPAEVAAAAASYLTANPPAPGRPPSAEEISAAVSEYFARNPVPAGQPGEDGRDGQPGRPPTAEEIRAAVDAYLASNPPPPGPKGDVGPPGSPPDGFTMSLNGATQNCTRSGGTDTAPTYSCSGPTAPSTPDPGENQDGGTTTPPESEETP